MKHARRYPRGKFLSAKVLIDWAALEDYATFRRRMDALWEMVSKPLKFPNRRRREDREMPPKAA